MQELLNATEKFLRNVNEAGYSLRQAAEPVRQSAEQLNRGLNNFTAANQFTRQNLVDLTAQLNMLTKNFNGLADEFARTIEIIRDALDNYNAATNAALREKLAAFDKSMNQAFGYLKEIAEDFGDAHNDFRRGR